MMDVDPVYSVLETDSPDEQIRRQYVANVIKQNEYDIVSRSQTAVSLSHEDVNPAVFTLETWTAKTRLGTHTLELSATGRHVTPDAASAPVQTHYVATVRSTADMTTIDATLTF